MRGHVFINGVEKHVLCAYIGVNGKAQYIMKPPAVIRHGGSVEELSVGRRELAATTVGNYALFGGGTISFKNYMNGDFSPVVDAYNSSLTRTIATSLTEAKNSLAATTVGNYALFGGGFKGRNATSSITSTVDAYDTSLTKTTAPNLNDERYDLAATTVGNYALFSSGTSYRCALDAYDTSLTKTTTTDISLERRDSGATTVGNYALFGGGYGYGYYGNTSDITSTVDAYDTSLTKTTAPDLSISKRYLAATTVGNYALFGGGIHDPDDYIPYSTVDVYDTSLTKTTAPDLSKATYSLAATTVGNYALFGGGSDSPTVDIYDTSLTRTTSIDLTKNDRYELAATTVGNYALFAGGSYHDTYGNNILSSAVDVYECAP